jgi:hypothetical protein
MGSTSSSSRPRDQPGGLHLQVQGRQLVEGAFILVIRVQVDPVEISIRKPPKQDDVVTDVEGAVVLRASPLDDTSRLLVGIPGA